jgi:hypothetical protein
MVLAARLSGANETGSQREQRCGLPRPFQNDESRQPCRGLNCNVASPSCDEPARQPPIQLAQAAILASVDFKPSIEAPA